MNYENRGLFFFGEFASEILSNLSEVFTNMAEFEVAGLTLLDLVILDAFIIVVGAIVSRFFL